MNRKPPSSRRIVAAALLLLAAVGVLWLIAITAGDAPGDRRIAGWTLPLVDGRMSGVPGLGAAFLTSLANVFTNVGRPLPAALLTLVGAAALTVKMGPRYGFLLLAAATVGVATTAMKLIGPRPGATEAAPSFPSGHTAYATAVLGTAAALAAERGHRRLAAATVAAILLMGVTRVLGLSHWLSDVLAGYALGGAWLVLILGFGMPWAKRGGDRTGD